MEYNNISLGELITNPSNSKEPFVYEFGVAKRNEIVSVEFDFAGDEVDLIGVKHGCSCSNVWVEGKKIRCDLTLNTAVASDVNAVRKVFTAYFSAGGKNDQPEFIVGNKEKKKFEKNPKAPFILQLIIKGTIIQ